MKVFASIVLCALFVSGCAKPGGNVLPMKEEAAVTLRPLLVHARTILNEPDSIHLFEPFGLVLLHDSIYVLDGGNDRIVVLDTMLRAVRTFGRPGAGPGELQAGVAMKARGDSLIVGDLTNRRFILFTPDGSAVRYWPSPAAPFGFDMDSRGRIFIAHRTAKHFAMLAGRDGAMTPVAPIPPDDSASGATEEGLLPNDMLAITEGDTLHFFDNVQGVLSKYAPDGSLVMRRLLPPELLERQFAEREATDRGFRRQGLRASARPLAISMAAPGRRSLLLRIDDGDAWGLLIDPHDYSVRRIETPRAISDAAPLRRATLVKAIGTSLYVLAGDEVFVYHLQEPIDAA